MPADFGPLIAYWGEDRTKVPEEALRNFALAGESYDFLTHVGLPAREDLPFPLFKDPANFIQWQYSGSALLVIAEEFGQNLCVKSGDGSIIAIDARGELPSRFVNSSAPQLATFLMVYHESQNALRAATDEQAAKLVAELKHKFTEFDAVAMADAENWWPVVLEQVEEGLV